MRFVSGSASSSDDEEEKDLRDAWRRRVRPDNQIPITLGTAFLLARTDDLAVAISALRVYANGLEFTVSARSRGDVAGQGLLLSGFGGHRPRGQHGSVDRFLLGFEFSDGRSVTNVESWPPALPDVDDHDGPWLTNGGGGGSDRVADHDFFLAPLPPGERLTLVGAWPSLGIAEFRQAFDAVAIRAAAAQVIELWPPQLDADDPEPPPSPVVPPGSWFERN
ncbi:hypothetical protein SAMN05892883_4339 [Jatrophihabitans sp. GAS493]|uniref:hypothetical protein n=1 Tax=Jatrophihabitans sp. GAS493 TaxID=1907575 RepID=UPI000BB817D1|nr:hypothetical protein [Jatrophihabitans sp. GAS493]SOD75134.1 hypothetical protein SAMN05892883_4339 [Jatrophihabitans sp. GAS493]